MDISCQYGERLSDAERAVVDYINKQKYIINLLSISDVAEGAFTSNATVSRAIRKCGFSSFPEMKFRFSEDTKHNPISYEMNKILSMSFTECMETIKRIDISEVARLAELLRSVKTVFILANGLTALVAEEFAFQLRCQKIHVDLISDSQLMKKVDLLATEEDLVVIISVKNSTRELEAGARLAKKAGAKVAVCCCTKGTPLDAVADISIYGYTQSINPNYMFGGTSRLGLMIITRTILEYLLADSE